MANDYVSVNACAVADVTGIVVGRELQTRGLRMYLKLIATAHSPKRSFFAHDI